LKNARRILDLAEEYKIPLELLWKPAGGVAGIPSEQQIQTPPKGADSSG
jgi:acetyl-CoA carboxylase alpha subunit